KTELTGIFTAQKAFYVEYSTYTAGMNQIGYFPEGVETSCTATNCNPITGVQRTYTVGFNTAASVCDAASCPGVTAGNVRKFNNSSSMGTVQDPTNATTLANCADTATIAGGVLVQAGAGSCFKAAAIGYPARTTSEDRW